MSPRPRIKSDEEIFRQLPDMSHTKRYAALLAIGLTLSACSTKGVQDEPAMSSDADAPSNLSVMIVLRPSGGHEIGDSVRVDLPKSTSDGDVMYYAGDGRRGTVSLATLGPTRPGTMVVIVDRTDVRRCRSTGCSVVGYVERGQKVEVSDFIGRWYRAAVDEVATGYILARDVQLPVAYRWSLDEQIRKRTAEYYAGSLEGLAAGGSGSLFSGYQVKLEDDVLAFEFYSPFRDGPGLVAACRATRGIVDFVEDVMAGTTQHFSAYSVGVYLDSKESAGATDLMLAGPTGEGGIYCADSG